MGHQYIQDGGSLGRLLTPNYFSVLSLSSATMTTFLILVFCFMILSVYCTSLTVMASYNKRHNVFFVFTRWAFNYLTSRPFRTVWGFLFRSVFILVAVIIFLSNFLGLISISFVLTSYLSVTLTLAMVAFVSFNLASFVFFETNWLKVFLPYNLPILTIYPVVALEFVSYTLRVVSLSVRLFANITSGHLLINVLSSILWSLATSILTISLAVIWLPFSIVLLAVSAMEVFISFLQGFVFLILLKIYSDDSLNVVQDESDVATTLVSYELSINSEEALNCSDAPSVSKANLETSTGKKKPAKRAKKATPSKKPKAKTKAKVSTAEDESSGKEDKQRDATADEFEFSKAKSKALDYAAVNKEGAADSGRIAKNAREDYGVISKVDGGIIYITGLYNLSVGEIVYFGRNLNQAITLNLERNVAKAVIFSSNDSVAQGTPVFRTFRLMKVPVNQNLLGKVIDCLGNSLVPGEAITTSETQKIISRTVDVKALGVIDRKSINEPLVTGVLSIDAMLPIGRGQRELIIGDRQLGKTSLAVDSIISQKNLHVSE